MILPSPPVGYSAEAVWMRRMHDFVSSLKLLPGVGYRIRQTPRGVILEMGQSPGGPNTSRALDVRTFQVTSADVSGDCIACLLFDPVTESTSGSAVRVALPWLMQSWNTVKTVPIFGEVDYTYTLSAQKRVASWSSGANIEVQLITEPYAVGDVITAVSATTGVVYSSADVTWLDLNVDGRAWAWVPGLTS